MSYTHSASLDSTPSTHVTTHETSYGLKALFMGMLMPLSFAPFHFPGLAFLSLALFYRLLIRSKKSTFFKLGLFYGIGYFSIGVSWIGVSIHEYGHLGLVPTLCITCLFILYLSLYLAGSTALFGLLLKKKRHPFYRIIAFASCWTLAEYLRSTLFTGFPWLLTATGQMDSPMQHLLPILGLFGTGYVCAVAAAVLGEYIYASKQKKWLLIFITLLIFPLTLKNINWTRPLSSTLSVGLIQANLSMRDKWDERLFWKLIDHYQEEIHRLLKKKELIILPESAIPLPSAFVSDLLHRFDDEAKKNHRGLLLGIPSVDPSDQALFYNSLIGLGEAQGQYHKQHLVPFGEYVPLAFAPLQQWLNLPPNMSSGQKAQPLLHFNHHPFASLICYELAYPSLLRTQLPQAEWIVSISDDGWFGHSLALFQHVQIAQATSKQTGRYQIMSNNNGLSALIDAKGQLVNRLPAFSQGILEGDITPYQGKTPWSFWGDIPIIVLILICFIIITLRMPK